MPKRAFPSFLLALLAIACSPASVGNPDTGPTADQACTDSAYARCSRLNTCSPIAVQVRYGDVTTCESLMKASCLGALAAPSTGSTVATSEGCTQAIPGWDCNDYIQTQNPPPACVQTTGSLGAGAGCGYAQQCQSGFCAIVPGALCGVCAAPPQPGDACTQLTSCGMTMSCVGGTCLPPAQPMAACVPQQSCTVGYECIGANYTTGTPGTCQLAVESLGLACSSTTNECDFFAGLTCNNQSKQCVAAPISGAGQPCNYVMSASESMYCGGGSKCLSPTPASQGVCAATSPVGGACDLAAGPDCVSPSRCIVAGGGTSGACQIPDATACP